MFGFVVCMIQSILDAQQKPEGCILSDDMLVSCLTQSGKMLQPVSFSQWYPRVSYSVKGLLCFIVFHNMRLKKANLLKRDKSSSRCQLRSQKALVPTLMVEPMYEIRDFYMRNLL